MESNFDLGIITSPVQTSYILIISLEKEMSTKIKITVDLFKQVMRGRARYKMIQVLKYGGKVLWENT